MQLVVVLLVEVRPVGQEFVVLPGIEPGFVVQRLQLLVVVPVLVMPVVMVTVEALAMLVIAGMLVVPVEQTVGIAVPEARVPMALVMVMVAVGTVAVAPVARMVESGVVALEVPVEVVPEVQTVV